MRGRIVAIGGSDLVTGLGLLGIEGVQPAAPEDARAAVARALDDPGVALVLIEERVAAELHDLLGLAAVDPSRPLVVELPSTGAEVEGAHAPPAGSPAPLRTRVERALGLSLGG